MCLVRRVDPGAGDNACAVAWTDPGLECLDDRVKRRSIDQAFVDEERLDGFDPQRDVRRDDLVIVSGRVLGVPALWLRHEGGSTRRGALQKPTPIDRQLIR